jgi:hypothetical protein
MKRQMINHEQLKFPSGVAAAETLRSLYASGEEAMQKAKSLFASMGAGAVIKWLVEGHAGLMEKLGITGLLAKLAVPADLPWSFSIMGGPAARFGLSTPVDPMMMAAGAIVGLRTAVSMAVGALVLYGVLGPWLEAHHVFAEMKALGALASDATSAGNVRKWGLWTGSSMMVTAGLTAFAFQWKSVVRALSGLGAVFGGKKASGPDVLAGIEVPFSWTAAGLAVSGAGCVGLMWFEYDIKPWWGVMAVAMTFVLALVACRATGETDITPIGAMGKVKQLTYGTIMPQSVTANILTANITSNAAAGSSDQAECREPRVCRPAGRPSITSSSALSSRLRSRGKRARMPRWQRDLLLHFVLPTAAVFLLFCVCYVLVLLGPLEGISGRGGGSGGARAAPPTATPLPDL